MYKAVDPKCEHLDVMTETKEEEPLTRAYILYFRGLRAILYTSLFPRLGVTLASTRLPSDTRAPVSDYSQQH